MRRLRRLGIDDLESEASARPHCVLSDNIQTGEEERDKNFHVRTPRIPSDAPQGMRSGVHATFFFFFCHFISVSRKWFVVVVYFATPQ